MTLSPARPARRLFPRIGASSLDPARDAAGPLRAHIGRLFGLIAFRRRTPRHLTASCRRWVLLPPYSHENGMVWIYAKDGASWVRRPGMCCGAGFGPRSPEIGKLLRLTILNLAQPANRRQVSKPWQQAAQSSRRTFLDQRRRPCSRPRCERGFRTVTGPIGDILSSPKRGNWDDQFDAQVSAKASNAKVSTTTPIFSPETIGNTEQAIGQYSGIVAQGGWPEVPATKKLRLGVTDPDVEVLRKRLIVSGDLSARRRHIAVVRHLCRRRVEALPAPPWPAGRRRDRQIHLCGHECFRAGAPWPARDQSGAARSSMSGDLGQRYVCVNIPAAQVEAVENHRVVLRQPRSSARSIARRRS